MGESKRSVGIERMSCRDDDLTLKLMKAKFIVAT